MQLLEMPAKRGRVTGRKSMALQAAIGLTARISDRWMVDRWQIISIITSTAGMRMAKWQGREQKGVLIMLVRGRNREELLTMLKQLNMKEFPINRLELLRKVLICLLQLPHSLLTIELPNRYKKVQ
jgi:hypothetical protein